MPEERRSRRVTAVDEADKSLEDVLRGAEGGDVDEGELRRFAGLLDAARLRVSTFLGDDVALVEESDLDTTRSLKTVTEDEETLPDDDDDEEEPSPPSEPHRRRKFAPVKVHDRGAKRTCVPTSKKQEPAREAKRRRGRDDDRSDGAALELKEAKVPRADPEGVGCDDAATVANVVANVERDAAIDDLKDDDVGDDLTDASLCDDDDDAPPSDASEEEERQPDDSTMTRVSGTATTPTMTRVASGPTTTSAPGTTPGPPPISLRFGRLGALPPEVVVAIAAQLNAAELGRLECCCRAARGTPGLVELAVLRVKRFQYGVKTLPVLHRDTWPKVLQRWEWTRSSRSLSTRMDGVAAAFHSLDLHQRVVTPFPATPPPPPPPL